MQVRSQHDHVLIPFFVFANVFGLVGLGLDPAAAVELTAATGAVAVGMIRALPPFPLPGPGLVVREGARRRRRRRLGGGE